MRKLLLITLIGMMSISLTACGETKEEKIVNNIIDMTEKAGEQVTKEEKEIIKDALENNEDYIQEMNKDFSDTDTTLKVLKKYKKCLKGAEDLDEAIECFWETNKFAISLGLEDQGADFNANEEFGSWSKIEKEAFLKDIAEGEAFMEKMNK